jgi:hypothetical protein
MNYSRITLEAGMVIKKASGDDSLLQQGARKRFRTPPPKLGSMVMAAMELFVDGGLGL